MLLDDRSGHLRILVVACAIAAGIVAPDNAVAAAKRPPAPAGLAITDVGRSSARIVWSAGDERVSAYRVYRGGRTFKRVRGLSLRVNLSRRAQRFAVAALDARGRAGRRTRSLEVVRGHRPPARPSRLKVTRATTSRVRLSWRASSRGSGRIAGYRIYRDRALVRQVHGRSGSDHGLAAATRYRYTVAAIDTQGYMSSRTATVSVATARPASSRGAAHAFLLATTGESFRDLQRHYRQIGTVYPTYFECASNGAVTGQDDPLVTEWSRLRDIDVLPRFDCQRTTALHTILTSPSLRSTTIARLVALVRAHDYDGINLDFEQGPAGDRNALTAFVSELGSRLHAIGKRITVDVSAKFQHTTTGRSGLYDYEALGRVADRVFVMNWGWFWSTSGPGPPDEMERCRKVADYVASMPNASRFVLGTNLYGMDWPNGGGPSNKAGGLEHAQVQELIARYGATPRLDPQTDAWTFTYTDAGGTPHEVWYPDAATVARRVQLARNRGLGVGFWRLGEEDQRVWSDPQIAPGTSWP